MIQLNNINFGYHKKYPMFQDLNLSLEKGHVYGLLGKNGAGKSTLLKNIIGALHPHSGACVIDGEFTHNKKVSTLKKMYYLPEQIVLPPVSISTFSNMNKPFYPNFSQEMFDSILSEFEIPKHLKLTNLSHGQQKKVAISFAIATNTEWLFLDEPTNGLDIPSKSLFRKVIGAHVNEDRGIVISTHQITDIQNLIENLVVIDSGKVLLNMDVYALSQKLNFVQTNNRSLDMNETLYCEDFGLGYRAILENKNGAEGNIDIELLFNALVSKQSKLLTILN